MSSTPRKGRGDGWQPSPDSTGPTTKDLSHSLPDAITARDTWLCWKVIERDGKPTKVPIDPGQPYSGRVDPTNPMHWTDVQTAHNVAEDVEGIAGIGFVFISDGPLVGVDLDDCRVPETGTVSPEARGIVDRLDSYTEVSPSGTGLHTIIEAKDGIPDGGNRNGHVEMYDGNRFFTVTGNSTNQQETVEARQTELDAIHAQYIAADKETQQSGTQSLTENTGGAEHTEIDVDVLVSKASASRSKTPFAQLWRGNWQGQYDSHSEARMALYGELAFWCGESPSDMWSVFTQSGLYPHGGKCDRLKDEEIGKAIQGNSGTYSGSLRS